MQVGGGGGGGGHKSIINISVNFHGKRHAYMT